MNTALTIMITALLFATSIRDFLVGHYFFGVLFFVEAIAYII